MKASSLNSTGRLQLIKILYQLKEAKHFGIHIGLILVIGIFVGVAVIISTHFVSNIKLLIGIIGGITFVLITMHWPEIGILCLVALLSGLISTSWLPVLHLGPVSLNISDGIILILVGLLFLRATTQKGFVLYGSPIMVPLLLFLSAILFSGIYAILFQGVHANTVLRTIRVLFLWIVFIPTSQLVRDKNALHRLLVGFSIFTVILLIGVLFPNKFDPLLPIEVRIAGTGSEIYSDFSRNYYAGDMILYAMIPATIASLAISKKKNQLWRLGLLILLFIWIFRTFFRNYWLTLFTTCIFLIGLICTQDRLRLIKRMIPAVIIGVVIVIGLAVNQPTQVERVLYILTDRLGSLLQDPIRNEGSLQWRAIETRAALEQIRNNPIIGIGLANSYRTPMAGESDAMYSGWASKYVENGYLYITVMMGLLGLIPFLWMCIIYLYRFFRYQNMVQDDCLRPFYLGFGLAFLGMFISNLVVPTFVIGTRLIFFPVSMAINEIIMRLENKRTIK